MSKLNAKKFEETYLSRYKIELLLDNRIETNMSVFKREELKLEFKKKSKRLNLLRSKINKEIYDNSELPSILCCDFDDFTIDCDLDY